MKKVTIVLLVIIFFVTTVIVFYFWAQQGSGYLKLQLTNYYGFPATGNDSVIGVVTYNAGYLSGMENNLAVTRSGELFSGHMKRLVQQLKQGPPVDLLAFQEIDYGSHRSFMTDQHDAIAKHFFSYSLKAVNWDKRYVPFPYWPPSVHFGKILSGQSVMSVWELTDPERIVLPKVASNPFYYNAFYLDRLVVSALVHHPLHPFWIMNIHAEAFDQETREKQIRAIYRIFKEKSKHNPVILTGDFNSSPDSGEKSIHLFLDDPAVGCAAMNSGTPYPPTFPSDDPHERIDYIFYTKADFEETASMVLTSFGTISDHLPVYARLKIRKGT